MEKKGRKKKNIAHNGNAEKRFESKRGSAKELEHLKVVLQSQTSEAHILGERRSGAYGRTSWSKGRPSKKPLDKEIEDDLIGRTGG